VDNYVDKNKIDIKTTKYNKKVYNTIKYLTIKFNYKKLKI